jgi:hypothetical protein
VTNVNLTGNKTHDAVVVSSELARQAVCNVSGASQSTQNAAYVTMYRALLASKITNSLDCGNEIFALKTLGASV